MTCIKKSFTLEFDLVEQDDKDDIETLYSIASATTFSGYPGSTDSYTVHIISDNLSSEVFFDHTNTTPYYSFTINLEEE
jgi:hypothetical protein